MGKWGYFGKPKTTSNNYFFIFGSVGGNLAAISASRLSTLLHQAGDMSRNGRPRMSFLSMFKDTCHSFVRPNCKFYHFLFCRLLTTI